MATREVSRKGGSPRQPKFEDTGTASAAPNRPLCGLDIAICGLGLLKKRVACEVEDK
jgi:hypothetical protein